MEKWHHPKGPFEEPGCSQSAEVTQIHCAMGWTWDFLGAIPGPAGCSSVAMVCYTGFVGLGSAVRQAKPT